MIPAEFLLLVFEDERAHLEQTPRSMAERLDAQARFTDGLRARGVLRDHARLRPSAEGRRVRTDDVVSGPFLDGGRALALVYLLQVPTLDEATALGARFPALPTDVVEVRPVMKGFVGGDRALVRGKVFAFGVLGRAPSQAAWTDIMDRIDAETSGHFPRHFLGGVRLQPPSRALFDGPFMESKEVIGGLFFLRAASMEDATAWARSSRFVAHGTLEIREVWR